MREHIWSHVVALTILAVAAFAVAFFAFYQPAPQPIRACLLPSVMGASTGPGPCP